MSYFQDFDSERIYYSNQQLKAAPPDYEDPFEDENLDLNANLEGMTEEERSKYNAEKEKRKNDAQLKLISDQLTTNGAKFSLDTTRRHFKEFLRNYQLSNVFIYRDAILAAARKGHGTVEFSLSHLNEYDPAMLNLLMNAPSQIMPVFEQAALDAYKTLTFQQQEETEVEGDEEAANESSQPKVTAIHLTVSAPHLHPVDLRKITSTHVNKLIKCPGIVISATRIRSKAMKLRMTCKDCFHMATTTITSPYGNTTLPFRCQAATPPTCSPNPYQILPDECGYVDIQSLKLQEAPEAVPTGEMPRNILLCLDRSLIDKAKPGMRVNVIGIASLFAAEKTRGDKGESGAKTLYVHVLGLQYENTGMGGLSAVFSPREEVSKHTHL